MHSRRRGSSSQSTGSARTTRSKHGGGIIGRFFLSRKQITVDQALQQEKSRRSELREAFESEKTAPPKFYDLKSGDSLVLS